MKLKARQRVIGPFDCVEVEGSAQGPVVVLFHGYGADMKDLAPLAGVISAPPGTTWIFPNGPMDVDIGGGFSGRAWFPIDMNAIQAAMVRGEHRDMSDFVPPGLSQRRQEVQEFLKALNKSFSKIVIGGFSQGSMLAVDACAHMSQQPAALVVLSGNLVFQKDLIQNLPIRKGLRFFQSHGRNDPLLGFLGAQKLEKVMLQAGLKGQLLPFTGGHEIPDEVVTALGRFIVKTFSAGLFSVK